MRAEPAARDGSEGWGATWRAVLEQAGAAAARRVQRGQALARRGAVEEVRVDAGRIAARVVEDRTAPVETSVTWPVASESAWDRVAGSLAGELRFTAALLDGGVPVELGEAMAAAGVRLAPRLDELAFGCSCDEPAAICRHVAALVTAVATLVDRDPGLLLRIRGRRPADLLQRVRADQQDGRPAPVPDVDLALGLETPRGDLEAIELRPVPVDDPGALVRHLGDPPGVDDERALVSLIERAAAAAWRLAAGDGAAAADEEVLLAELRAQRSATAAALAEALGRDPEPVRGELDRLFDGGLVLRTGSGDRARYRAASS